LAFAMPADPAEPGVNFSFAQLSIPRAGRPL
jgi:hypothetical protein